MRTSTQRADAGGADLVVMLDVFPELSETFVVSELRALDDAGVAVRVEAGRRGARDTAVADLGLGVHYAQEEPAFDRAAALVWLVARHPSRALADLVARRRWRREEPVPPLREIAPIARRLHRDRRARLHCHFAAGAALTALRMSKLCRRPYGLTAHAYDIWAQPRNLPEKLARADVVTTGCMYNVRHLRTLVDPARRDRIHEIVMGVDVRGLTRRTPHVQSRTVIAIGRLVEKKGFADLVRALALLAPQTVERLVLIGEGPLAAELAELTRELGLSDRVELTGALEHSRVRDQLEAADVLAMPCVVAADGDRDSMPVVVKEALALELPVVATDEVGLPEVVRPEWGRLVPPHDPAALARALKELLDLPPARRAAMGRAGRAWVAEHCDVRRETAKLAELLGLAADHPAGAA